jgi:hypothetical protein
MEDERRMTNDESRGTQHVIPTIDLLDLEHDELQALLKEWGQPGYRADQVWRWLYASLVASPDQMTNLPKPLRARLADETRIGTLTPIAHQRSQDGETIKWLFESSPPRGGPRGGPSDSNRDGTHELRAAAHGLHL